MRDRGEGNKAEESPVVARLLQPGALVEAALSLGARSVAPISTAEARLLNEHSRPAVTRIDVAHLQALIVAGGDPLGDAFCRLRSAEARRPLGATYTPSEIVRAMVSWASKHAQPQRVIDPGAGSARFLLAAGAAFPTAELVGVEVDPLAALLARANIAAAGLAGRASVVLEDFRLFQPRRVAGVTLYIGNPPYVRHHQLGPDWKDWLVRTARRWGKEASQLAGLHVHFFLATLEHATKGDVGCYITSSEWLDVNYGSLVRQLLLDGLGGSAVHVLDPKALPFADAATTGAISCFTIGARPSSLRLRRIEKVGDLKALEGGRPVKRDRLRDAPRWSVLMRTAQPVPDGFVELGEICRVHRGAVTGANAVWVTRAGDDRLPASVLRHSVTKARELFSAGSRMVSADTLRCVIDLPADLDILGGSGDDDRKRVERFLRWARAQGAHTGYIAKHRKSWWSVGLRCPAPILATYMARRPPAFVRNLVDARHINIAHGLYPREPMSETLLDRLAEALGRSMTVGFGRTYAGGLTKFEPREMERLTVPSLELLAVL